MWYIKAKDKDLFIASSIDSSGMSVFLVAIKYADEFDTELAAQQFLTRVNERYPQNEFTVEFIL